MLGLGTEDGTLNSSARGERCGGAISIGDASDTAPTIDDEHACPAWHKQPHLHLPSAFAGAFTTSSGAAWFA